MADLHVIYDTNYRELLPTLRKIADSIEAGEYGDVTQCAVVLFGDDLKIFGMGPDSEATSIGMLFSAAHLRVAKALEEHGQDG